MNTRIRDLVAYLDTYLKRYDRDKLIGSKQMKVTKHARGKLREISGIDVYTSSDVCKMGASLKKKKKKKKNRKTLFSQTLQLFNDRINIEDRLYYNFNYIFLIIFFTILISDF